MSKKEIANDKNYHIEKVKQLADKINKRPTREEYLEYGKANGWDINFRKYYSTWTQLLQDCEFDLPCKEYFIKRVTQLAEILQKKPTLDEYYDAARIYKWSTNFKPFFKNWTEILIECKLIGDIAEDKDYFIKKIISLSKKLNKTPSYMDYRKLAIKNKWDTNYKRFFKSWNELIEACNLKKLVIFFNREEFKKNLCEYYNISKGDLTCSKFKEYCREKNYNTTFNDYYDTWNDALIDCGFEIEKTDSLYYIKKVKTLHKELGHTPTSTEYLCIAKERGWTTNYLAHFSSWNDLIEQAQLPAIDNYRRFNKEDLIKNFNNCKKELGKVPTCREYMDYCVENKLNTNFLNYYDGKWNNLLDDMNVNINSIGFYTDEQIVRLIEDKIKETGELPNVKDLEEDPNLPSYSAIQSHFGGLSNIYIKLGYDPIKMSYTKQEIKYMMKNFYENNNRIPRFDEHTYSNKLPSIKQIYIKFGGIEKCYQDIYGPKFKIPTIYGYYYKSNHGDIRPSIFDGKIDNLLGQNGVRHEHEIPYKNFIKECDREFISDYQIDGKFFIEAAGIITEEEFLNIDKIKDKKKKDYAINLLEKINCVEISNSDIKLIVIFKNSSIKKINKLLEPVYAYAKENNHLAYELTEPYTLNERIDYTLKERVYSNEYLLDNIITRYYELERMPTMEDMKKEGWPYPSIYTKRKKWSEWKNEAELILDKNYKKI